MGVNMGKTIRKRRRRKNRPVNYKKSNKKALNFFKRPECFKKFDKVISSRNYKQALEILREECVDYVEGVEDKRRKVILGLMLSEAFRRFRHYEEAEKWCNTVLEMGEVPYVYNELCIIHKHQGDLIKAAECAEKALKLEPDSPTNLKGFGYVFSEIGANYDCHNVLDEAAKRIKNDQDGYSWYLLTLHDKEDVTAGELYEKHRKYTAKATEGIRKFEDHENSKEKDKKLRIGYVSPDIRKHSVAYFLETLLDGHDRKKYEIYCYEKVDFKDEVTKRLSKKFDKFVSIWSKSHEEAAEIIRKDKIDILVDLAGHTQNNSIKLFAMKPAPVEVTYLGYPDTTGLEEVDYRLTDELSDPVENHEFYTEKQVLLENGFLCYRPSVDAGGIGEAPYKKNGYVTFGTFNNNKKISPFILKSWCKLLNLCENSRIFLKLRGGEKDSLKEYYFNKFEQFGVSRDRVTIKGRCRELKDHYKMYSEIDIALDTYPYNGTTTTFEALWMGVPVVTLTGNHHAARVGYSILKNLGLEFFAAESEDEYIKKAMMLSLKPESIDKLRSSMRDRMVKSPLMDVKDFAAKVEKAYREMWMRWCDGESSDFDEPFRVEASERNIEKESELKRKKIIEAAKLADKNYLLGKRGEAVKYLKYGYEILKTGVEEVKLDEEFLARYEVKDVNSFFLKMLIELVSFSSIMNPENYEGLYSVWQKSEPENTEANLRKGLLSCLTAMGKGEKVSDESIKMLKKAEGVLNDERAEKIISLAEGKLKQICLDYDDSKINLFPEIDNITTYSLLELGDWFEKGDMKLFRSLIREGDDILDLGANVGVYSISGASRTGDEGKVIGVEPAKETYELLEKSSRQFSNMYAVNAAVSDESGEGFLSYGSSSELNKLSDEGDGEKVRLCSVDDLAKKFGVEKFDIIKMDVEGHEIEAIEGAEKMIKEGRPVIFYEIKDGDGIHLDLIEKFGELGYDSYYYVEPANSLVKYEKGESVDPYILNMIAVKNETLERFENICNVFGSYESFENSLA